MNVVDFIEEELGLDVTAEQRRVLEAMFPPDPPYVPPKVPWYRRAKWWLRRLIFGKDRTLANFDRALRDTYAPALRAQINQASPLTAWLRANPEWDDGVKGGEG